MSCIYRGYCVGKTCISTDPQHARAPRRRPPSLASPKGRHWSHTCRVVMTLLQEVVLFSSTLLSGGKVQHSQVAEWVGRNISNTQDLTPRFLQHPQGVTIWFMTFDFIQHSLNIRQWYLDVQNTNMLGANCQLCSYTVAEVRKFTNVDWSLTRGPTRYESSLVA